MAHADEREKRFQTSFVAALARRLRRQTTSGRYLPEVDGVRAVAIAMVVFFHLLGYLADRSRVTFDSHPALLWRIVTGGGRGVPVFFILSGFVLGLPFAARAFAEGPPVSLRRYFARRLTRLEPPYIVALLLLGSSLWLTHRLSVRELVPHTLASAVYLHNVIYSGMSLIDPVAWSLEVEVQFYLLAPLLAAAYWLRRRTRWLLFTALIAGCTAADALLNWPARLAMSLPRYLQFFLVGQLLAECHVVFWRRPSARPWAWDLAAAGALLAIGALCNAGAYRSPLWLGPMVLLFCATFRGCLLRRLLAKPIVASLGGMCYSIYLLHFSLISFIGRHTVHIGEWLSPLPYFILQSLLILPPLLVVTTMFYLLCEQPCMDPNWPSALAARLDPRSRTR